MPLPTKALATKNARRELWKAGFERGAVIADVQMRRRGVHAPRTQSAKIHTEELSDAQAENDDALRVMNVPHSRRRLRIKADLSNQCIILPPPAWTHLASPGFMNFSPLDGC